MKPTNKDDQAPEQEPTMGEFVGKLFDKYVTPLFQQRAMEAREPDTEVIRLARHLVIDLARGENGMPPELLVERAFDLAEAFQRTAETRGRIKTGQVQPGPGLDFDV